MPPHRTLRVFALTAAIVGATAGTAAAQEVDAPLVDHHQHLISAATVAMIHGERTAPAIAVPQDIAAVLRKREDARRDRAALASLFTADAHVVVAPALPHGWLLGATTAASYLSERLTGRFTLTPTAVGAGDVSGWVAGYITTGEGAAMQRHGTFHHSLTRAGGSWRIAVESVVLNAPGPRYEVIDADRLVRLLDSAGIRRAVVLSGAFGFGGRGFDIYRHVTAEARAARVRAENDWTADQVARYPDRLVAFCSFNPLDSYAMAELQRCVSGGRFKGLKLHLDENEVDLQRAGDVLAVRTIFAAANAARLPIVVHVGNNRENARENVAVFLDRIASAAPDVVIQVAHLHGGGRFSAEALAAYADAVSSGHPSTRNMFFDVTEIDRMGDAQAMRDVAMRMRQIGLTRMLYGSDPAMPGKLTPREGWASFRARVPLTADEFRTIAGNVAPYLR